MDITLSRRRTLSDRQRRKKIIDPSKLDFTSHEWPMKTRIRIFCPYFEWDESVHLELSEIIGRGKFSSVLKCRIRNQDRDTVDRTMARIAHQDEPEVNEDDHSEDLVAVKVLDKSTVISQSMSKQICQERRIQSVCSNHPYVLPLLRVWQDDRKLYMALPLCDRGQLFQVWSSRRNDSSSFSALTVCVAALQLSSALSHIHSLGIIYRDLKLNNVLISRRGDLQVSDFGLSKWLGRHERTRTICGTLAYMAPEVLEGTPYGHAADWWSLGVLLHCLTAMNFPFVRGRDHTEMLTNILETTLNIFKPEDDESSVLGDEVLQLLKSLIVIDSNHRLTSFRQLETCCQSTLTYDQMINNGISFLSTLNLDDLEHRVMTVLPEDVESSPSIPPDVASDVPMSHDEELEQPIQVGDKIIDTVPQVNNPKKLVKRASLETPL